MALAIRKKKKPATALVPFSPEAVFQGEPSLQNAKFTMFLQVLALFIQPMWNKFQPILTILKMRGMPIPDSLEELIQAASHQMSDEIMKASIDSVCLIMQAVADDQVTQGRFEQILLANIEVIKVVNSTKVEEVPA